MKFIVKNEGHSVANKVAVRAQVFLAEWGEAIFTEPVKRQEAVCGNVGSDVHQTGITIFPKKSEEITVSFGLNGQEIETHRIELIKGTIPVYGLVPVLVGCIDYVFGDKLKIDILSIP